MTTAIGAPARRVPAPPLRHLLGAADLEALGLARLLDRADTRLRRAVSLDGPRP